MNLQIKIHMTRPDADVLEAKSSLSVHTERLTADGEGTLSAVPDAAYTQLLERLRRELEKDLTRCRVHSVLIEYVKGA